MADGDKAAAVPTVTVTSASETPPRFSVEAVPSRPSSRSSSTVISRQSSMEDVDLTEMPSVGDGMKPNELCLR